MECLDADYHSIIDCQVDSDCWLEVVPCEDQGLSQDCWNWQAATNNKPESRAYGQFWLNGKLVLAHRFSYETEVGQIPEGLQLDHLCRNPRCVRPDHLEPVTRSENVRRGNVCKPATHCKRGHEFTKANTYIRHQGGTRECYACRTQNNKNWRTKAALGGDDE